ncbi:ROK family protein [Lentisphaerota bacterium WC36G]|nr:ROK family protein [Lentisphaerae bacterium WC36]
MKLKNHSLIKSINRAIVLNKVRTKSPISRSQIAKETGLDKKSITNFVTMLLKEGLVHETGKIGASAGRPSTMLTFTEKFVSGIYVSPEFVEVIVIDLYGRIDFHNKIKYEKKNNLNAVKKAFNSAVKGIFMNHKAVDMLGIGVAFPGIIDFEKSTIIEAVNMNCLEGVDYSEEFTVHGVDVFYEHSPHCSALAHKWFGSGKNFSDFMVIDITNGIGAGIINNRRLFHGAGNYAGEIGHITIEKNGLKCRCGNYGCLEAYASEDIILEKINEFVTVDSDSLEDRYLEILANNDCKKILNDMGVQLAQALATSVNLLSPKVIVLNGLLIEYFGDYLLEVINNEIGKYCLKKCLDDTKITTSSLQYSHVIGAASLALSDIFEVNEYYYI